MDNQKTMKIRTWYEKVIAKNRAEIVKSTLATLLLVFTTTMYGYITGNTFEWQSIEPISEPSIFSRLLYSALTFVTIGAFLYKIGFYKFLYSLYRGTKNGWREYKKAKAGIWGLLVLLMFFIIVPFVVNVLNIVISVMFNVYTLLIYIFPSVIITMSVLIAGYFLNKKLNVM